MQNKIVIQLTDYNLVRQWHKHAIKENTPIRDSENTSWFSIHIDDGPAVGCGGLYRVSPQEYRLKGIFIVPACRGQGYGTMLTSRLIETAWSEGAAYVEAMPIRTEWYVKHGFYLVGKNGHGQTRVKCFPEDWR